MSDFKASPYYDDAFRLGSTKTLLRGVWEVKVAGSLRDSGKLRETVQVRKRAVVERPRAERLDEPLK